MKNILKKVTASLLALTMVFGYFIPVYADVISDANQVMTNAEKLLTDLENDLSDSEKNDVQSQIDSLKEAIDNKKDDSEIESLSQKLSDYQTKLTEKYANKSDDEKDDSDNDDDDSNKVTTSSTDSEDENTEATEAYDVDFSTLQLWDKFKDSEGITYTVDDVSANIYVGSGENQKLYPSNSTDIPNFEITYDENGHQTWRKYVKLEDLCNITKNDGSHICEIMHQTDMDKGKFYLKRIYKQKINESTYDDDAKKAGMREISLYYKSYHNVNEKRFEAILQLVNGESENDKDVIDTYTYDENQITSNEGQWSTETNEKGKEKTILIPDIETLKDKNGVVYVSLRFVSESLGAEVKWVSQENSKTKDDDDVYIQFYDDKEYCKNIEYTFVAGDGSKISPEDMEKSLYLKDTVMTDISLDGTYTYTDESGNTITSDVDWQKVYLLLTPSESYPNGFFNDTDGKTINLPIERRILWGHNDFNEKVLWVRGHVYGKFTDGTCEVNGTSYDCNLGEAVDITGIILYKGVPIPIDLFNVNDEKCSASS